MSLTLEAVAVPLKLHPRGVVRVGDTRVSLDTVVVSFQEGASAEEIVESYPTLELGDVYAVIAFYLGHRAEVEAYLDEQRREADRIRREYEALYPPKPGLRDRLLARRESGGPAC